MPFLAFAGLWFFFTLIFMMTSFFLIFRTDWTFVGDSTRGSVSIITKLLLMLSAGKFSLLMNASFRACFIFYCGRGFLSFSYLGESDSMSCEANSSSWKNGDYRFGLNWVDFITLFISFLLRLRSSGMSFMSKIVLLANLLLIVDDYFLDLRSLI